MIPITVLITTRNEESNIEKCLMSVEGVAEQVFVIDSESTDQTVENSRIFAADSENEHNKASISDTTCCLGDSVSLGPNIDSWPGFLIAISKVISCHFESIKR